MSSNRFSMAPLLLLGLGVSCVPVCRAQMAPAHGKVQLISEVSMVHPGQELWLGLDFQLEDGWHTYWINPGDSGQPAFVRWQLPPGWQAGAIRWPVPERIPDHSLIDYGYEKNVLLLVPVRTPAVLLVGETVHLAAMVEWLECRDVCVPARQHVELSLPVTVSMSDEYSSDRELFDDARKRWPESAPARWKATAVSEGDRFVLQVEIGHAETARTFLPLVPNQVQNASTPGIKPFKRGVRVTLVKSDQLRGPISHLTGILVMASGHAYAIDATVTSSNGTGKAGRGRPLAPAAVQ